MTGPRGSVASVRYTGSTGGTPGIRNGVTSSPAATMASSGGDERRPPQAARAAPRRRSPASTDSPNPTISPKRAGARSHANIGTAGRAPNRAAPSGRTTTRTPAASGRRTAPAARAGDRGRDPRAGGTAETTADQSRETSTSIQRGRMRQHPRVREGRAREVVAPARRVLLRLAQLAAETADALQRSVRQERRRHERDRHRQPPTATAIQ